MYCNQVSTLIEWGFFYEKVKSIAIRMSPALIKDMDPFKLLQNIFDFIH